MKLVRASLSVQRDPKGSFHDCGDLVKLSGHLFLIGPRYSQEGQECPGHCTGG